MIVCVRETDMGGEDIFWNWDSVKGSLPDGRFDFYWENGIYKKKEIRGYKNIEDLIEFIGHPFYLVEPIEKIRAERKSLERNKKLEILGL